MNEESRNGGQPITGAELANQQGVVVPPSAVAHSAAVKAARKKTLSQIPVYRASANLMYVATEIVMRMPNKLRKFSDLMLQNANDLLITIGSADQSPHLPEKGGVCQLHGQRVLAVFHSPWALQLHPCPTAVPTY